MSASANSQQTSRAEGEDRSPFEFLQGLRASDVNHAHERTLNDHLIGTNHVLKAWDRPLPTQLAGLFHSIYSTGSFKHAVLSVETDRETLRAVIGEQAESLVEHFANISFEEAMKALLAAEAIGDTVTIAAVRLGEDRKISVAQLVELVYIHAANVADQSAAPDGGPALWVARVARALVAIDRLTPLSCELLSTVAHTLTPQLERSCRAAYHRALSLLRSDLNSASSLLEHASALHLNAEPCIYLAALAEHNGDLLERDRQRERGNERLAAFGTCWDKRRSTDIWAALARGESSLSELLGQGLPPVSASPAMTGVEDLPRIDRYLRAFSESKIDARMSGYFPDLPQVRFPDPQRFKVVAELEHNIAAIRQEIELLDQHLFHAEAEKIERTGIWNVFMLYERGRRIDENCALCPVLASIVGSPECMRTLSGLIYVSRLAPGSHIATHVGPTNLRVRCHLGISVPSQGCRLEVGGEVVSWQQDRCLVFDDFFEHSAWNLGDQTRTVVIVDLWHPDLTPHEIAVISGMQSFAALVAPGLVRYWKKNRDHRDRRKLYD